MNGRFLTALAAAAMTLSPIGGIAPALAAPPEGGSIAVEVARPDGVDETTLRSFIDAAGEALAAKGFTILPDPDHAAYVAELALDRAEVGTGTAKAPTGNAAAGPGGAYGSVGAGVVIPLPTGNSTLVPLRRTRLELRIRKRGEAAASWHGTAVTIRAAGTRKGTDDAVATVLTQALLRGYPAEPEGVVGVP